MRFSILAVLLPLLATASPTPPAVPQTTLKLRVWNDPRSMPHYDGYVELHGKKLAYNITLDSPGFTSVPPPFLPSSLVPSRPAKLTSTPAP